QEIFFHPLLSIRQAVPHERQITLQPWIHFHREVTIGIETVVHRMAIHCSEPTIMLHHWRAAAVSKDEIVFRNQRAKGIAFVLLNSRERSRSVHIPKSHAGSG